MNFTDINLAILEKSGTPTLPRADKVGTASVDGADIWYASFGEGRAVVLLHGGMGSSDNWAYLVPELVERGFNVVTIDSRGQGRSTRDDGPYSYHQMAADVRAVMDNLGLARAGVVGWSDGAVTGLMLADETPERVERLFFFACNVDSSGSKPFAMTAVIGRMLAHQRREFAALSKTPSEFDRVFAAVTEMQSTQPEYTAEALSRIEVPIMVVLGERDEFIRRDHLEYLARTLPDATFRVLPGVSHFAPLQQPGVFNAAVLEFLDCEPAAARPKPMWSVAASARAIDNEDPPS